MLGAFEKVMMMRLKQSCSDLSVSNNLVVGGLKSARKGCCMWNGRYTNSSWLSPEKDLLVPGLGLGKLDELSLLAARIKSGSQSLIL